MEEERRVNAITWRYKIHMNMKHEHALMYESEYKGFAIRKEIHTKYPHGKTGKSTVIYWTPDIKTNFETLNELIQAIDELNKGE